tara:strand:+ start:439 stop:684 length:246 start_codon:yes stop_codon:yes gene_type:complete
MAEQNITIQTITTSPTTLSNLNSITILNGSSSNSLTLAVSGSANNVSLGSGQTLTLNASTGFTLPDLTITGTGLTANVVTS